MPARHATAAVAAALMLSPAAAAILAGSASPAAARHSSGRVPAGWFGTNVNSASLGTPWGAKALRSIRRRAGLRQVRFAIRWDNLEPDPPALGHHTYHFGPFDERIAAVARHRLRVQPMLGYTPAWDAASPLEYRRCRRWGAASARPAGLVPFRQAARAVARRYGRHGSFWHRHPRLPYRPIVTYEIWNAPNTVGSWCPAPEPERYGILFRRAENAIHAQDRHARVVVGGLGIFTGRDPHLYPSPRRFLRRAASAAPSMRRTAAAVAIHLFPHGPVDQVLDALPVFRRAARRSGFHRVPLLVNEVGWTRRGPDAYTEPERARRYRAMSRRLPRTNCNVGGMLAYTWSSRERDPSNPEEWFGIWNPETGLYRSAKRYRHSVALFRGHLQSKAPRRTLHLC